MWYMEYLRALFLAPCLFIVHLLAKLNAVMELISTGTVMILIL